VVAFFVTLFLSFWPGQLWARLTCPILGAILIGCWLFSVKGYAVDHGTISVEHPLWSARFEVRGLAPENRHPESGSIRLLASNWIFGDTLGLCYNKNVGAFLVYVTNANYRLDLETKRGGVLVISPLDKAALTKALPRPDELLPGEEVT
jgi:hypothetical protein